MGVIRGVPATVARLTGSDSGTTAMVPLTTDRDRFGDACGAVQRLGDQRTDRASQVVLQMIESQA